MVKKQTNQIRDIKKLLDEQTSVILSAVDEKLATTRITILSEVDKKLVKMEMRINQKIEKLTTTLDKFLKRLTNLEEELLFPSFSSLLSK
jgi:predicted RNA-binding protein Jag